MFLFQTRRRASKSGLQCVFHEFPAYSGGRKSHTQHHYQHIKLRSAHNPSWYLGFNRRRLTPRGPNLVALTRSQPPKRLSSHRSSCEYRFSTAQYHHRSRPQQEVWPGLWDALVVHEEENDGKQVNLPCQNLSNCQDKLF